jgi:cytochrome P450
MIAAGTLDERLTSPGFVQDPYPVYAALRETDPVYWCEPWDAWVVTSHAAVVEVLRRPDAFSSAGSELAALESLDRQRPGSVPSLIAHYRTPIVSTTDPPLHTRLRRRLVSSFTPHVVERLRPRVAELTDRLLVAIEGSDRVDLLDSLAYPLPALVIAELLGVPVADRAEFLRWSADIVAFVGTGVAAEDDRARCAEQSMRAFRASLLPLIRERRRRPTEDLIGLLVREDANELTDPEILATCVTLLFAGHETTANLIGNGLLALLRTPSEARLLASEPSLTERAVEELLRFDSPVQRNRRRAVADVELAGRRIRKGARVLAFLGAANRDPSIFAEPDRLDIRRRPTRHLAFGHGIHYCVGAALSRLEAPIVLTALLQRYPDLALADDVQFLPNIAFRGLRRLEVTFGPGAA